MALPAPSITDAQRFAALTPTTGKVDAVLDTDTYNEIDDQFALVYALLAPEGINLRAIYAAPFHNDRSTSPADGMAKSYDEILRVLDRMSVPPEGLVHRGSTSYLPGADEAVDSDAAHHLVEQAMAPREGLLYVLAIGAITNVASAILMEPRIAGRIVVVWLGGNDPQHPHTREFNLQQDLHAARVVFDSGVPLVWIPCRRVAEHLRTTEPEMAAHVRGRGAIGDYLYEIFRDYSDGSAAWSKVIWDIATVAWLLDPAWVPTVWTPSPILTDQLTWSVDASRHSVRVATWCDRDAVFGDLFARLESAASERK